MSEKMIAIELIDPPAWNSRLEVSPVEGLAQSMQADGQINAISVEGPTTLGRYELVTGSRRLRAAKINGWTEIKADVSPFTDVATRIIKNVTENQQREDLSLYEQARACARLREEGIKGVEVAKRTGFSPQHVSNLAIMYQHLPTLVTTAWSQKHPAATYDFLQSIVRVRSDKELKTDEARAEKMLAMWQNRVALQESFESSIKMIGEEEEEEEVSSKNGKNGKHGKNGKSDKDKPFKVTKDRYKGLCAAIKKSKMAGSAFALTALKTLVDEDAVIKGVFEPDEEGEAADA